MGEAGARSKSLLVAPDDEHPEFAGDDARSALSPSRPVIGLDPLADVRASLAPTVEAS
jgi:hypothetical protein